LQQFNDFGTQKQQSTLFELKKVSKTDMMVAKQRENYQLL